ncbi:MAG: RnfABCDGE type electron transport complex subunit G [Lachnospiraceae bacterium]
MKQILKDGFTLFLITVIAGLALGFVYEITKGPIAEKQAQAKTEAYQQVFAQADHFEKTTYDVEAFRAKMEEQGSLTTVDEVYTAFNAADEELGKVMTITNKEGYGGDITIALGITNEGCVNGIQILSLSETAGLGMKATEPEFYNQYADKTVDEYVVTKQGAASEQEIDAISGATITSNAVTKAVNAGLLCFRENQ